MTPMQCRAARSYLNISRDELAKEARLSVRTILEFEKEKRTMHLNNLLIVKDVLSGKGMVFCDHGCISPSPTPCTHKHR